ncbi:hypothetical protein EBF16_05440 [Sphingobium yanoikuyae]|uniref:Uncharacterized protein n=1 Tax=Sphingobium yanoikuyae TaxID=13690 RepID=A0A3G2UNQ3_SPHYA|nr:hypothetical protein EBF16_05440 [Sphingobium yanoikuyae]
MRSSGMPLNCAASISNSIASCGTQMTSGTSSVVVSVSTRRQQRVALQKSRAAVSTWLSANGSGQAVA